MRFKLLKVMDAERWRPMAVEEHLKVLCSSYSKTNIQISHITQMHAEIPCLSYNSPHTMAPRLSCYIPNSYSHVHTHKTFTLKQAKLHMNPVIQTTQFQF